MSNLLGTLISMYEIDATALGAGVHLFHAGLNELKGNIIWQGREYVAFPVEAVGFDISGNTQLPRPTLRISNVDQTIGFLVRSNNDLIGARLIRHRTFAKYLDEVNFAMPGGNPSADPQAELPLDEFIFERKSVENKLVVEFELVAAVDLQGVKLPKRQMLATSCNAVYKSARCGYAGGLATCDHGLSTNNGCEVHFGVGAELNFNGFPGCGLRR